MAYEKTNWVDGITRVDASNLNHIEEGIEQNSQDIVELEQKVNEKMSSFRGNWANWSAVPTNKNDYPEDSSHIKTPSDNDYLVIQNASDYPVSTGDDPLVGTWRFTYSGKWSTNGKNGWKPEHLINENPLTDAQMAALDSGITSTLVGLIGGYLAFPSSWRTNGTIAELFEDIENDSAATKGKVYLGEVTCSDLPFVGNADIVIEVIDGTGTNKVLVASINSGTTSPYYWRYTYWVIDETAHSSGWKSFIPSDKIVTSISDSSTNNNVPGAKCVYDAIQAALGAIDSALLDLHSGTGV